MRPCELDGWFISLRQLSGIGDKTFALFQTLLRKQAPVLRDVVMHVPVSTVDRRLQHAVSQDQEGSVVTLEVTVEKHYPPAQRFRRVPYRIACENESLSLILVFFNGREHYLRQQLPEGETRIISGKLEQGKQGWQMVHPQLIARPEEASHVTGIEPVYPLTQGLHHRKLLEVIRQAVEKVPAVPEWQDSHLRQQRKWPEFTEALKALHRPKTAEDVSVTSPNLQRLIYDELLASQLALAIIRQSARQRSKAPVVEGDGSLTEGLRHSLPFRLTQGQEQVLQEIAQDMTSGTRMLRLLQGDVGSGKTIVAMLAMLAVVEAGGQAALMVPTEILGRQHLKAFQTLLEPLRRQTGRELPIAFLSGSTPAADREQILYNIQQGNAQLIIGTHAIFQEKVAYDKLMLAVIDEQHRFGVNQRIQLAEKGRDTHILLMSATPIPRSLAMTLFGDMDVSKLQEKPAGRQEITTRVLPLSRYEKLMESLSQALKRGEKIYWICPLVEESEDMAIDLAAATERHREFCARFQGVAQVALVHGRIQGEAREQEMKRFASGEAQLLVATTVVEVGVDVPDATIMIIEHAERFGLAQLHQLRGRVGRGDKPSSCVLLYADKTSQTSLERLKAMRESNDGFFLAEEDLRLRGGGEIMGTRQSGLPNFRFAELPRDESLLKTARDEVKLILHQDSDLQTERGNALRMLLYLFDQDQKLRFLKS